MLYISFFFFFLKFFITIRSTISQEYKNDNKQSESKECILNMDDKSCALGDIMKGELNNDEMLYCFESQPSSSATCSTLDDSHIYSQSETSYLKDEDFEPKIEFNLEVISPYSRGLTSYSQNVIPYFQGLNTCLEKHIDGSQQMTLYFQDPTIDLESINNDLDNNASNSLNSSNNLTNISSSLEEMKNDLSSISCDTGNSSNETGALPISNDKPFYHPKKSSISCSDSDSNSDSDLNYDLNSDSDFDSDSESEPESESESESEPESESESESDSHSDSGSRSSHNINTDKEKGKRKYKRKLKGKKKCPKKRKKVDKKQIKISFIENTDKESRYLRLKKLSKLIAQDIFKIELKELSEYVVPASKEIFNVLNKNYNESKTIFNSCTSSLEEILDEELKNVNSYELENIKAIYNAFIKNKYNNPENAHAVSMSLTSVTQSSFTKKNEILDTIKTCLNNFNDLEQKIQIQKEIFKKLPKITYDFIYNHLIFFKFLHQSKKETNFFKMFDSMDDFIKDIEVATKEGYFIKNNIKLHEIGKKLVAITYNLKNINRILKTSLRYLKKMKISSRDPLIITKIIFHFMNEINRDNIKNVDKISSKLGESDITNVIRGVLLKEAKYISESGDRAAEKFNINVNELNLNNTYLKSLLKNKTMKYKLYKFYKNLMRLVRFQSLQYQLALVKKLFFSLKKTHFKKQIDMNKNILITGKKQKKLLLELENLKKIFNEVKLNVKCRCIYSNLRENIIKFNKFWDLLENGMEKNVLILNNLRNIIRDTSDGDKERQNTTCNEGILFMLFYAKESLIKYY
ncbi:surface-associated interspersed protein (SURFIN) [Plasmodium gallinaceum]|uniref:Surface-associated interspersed protein (SURFIN) n=1 Tax=Plasmodium gallinaceum TaxID=5849 RepID=A0A1J1GU05_PLAGA|nr:surface-associated interspersed protein (SURFIN) [Plasmodium gallinaceum]CRG95996.1 surface-associated interspersed protein (SURFIN) [Plasmodium gallinaceum]